MKPEDNLGIMNSLFYMIRSVISETRYLVLEVFMKRTVYYGRLDEDDLTGIVGMEKL